MRLEIKRNLTHTNFLQTGSNITDTYFKPCSSRLTIASESNFTARAFFVNFEMIFILHVPCTIISILFTLNQNKETTKHRNRFVTSYLS